MDKLWSLSIVVVVVLVVVKIWRACKAVFWRPYVLTRFFEKQGIRGPPYTPLYGSLPEIKKLGKAAHNLVLDVHQNDITPTVVPHYSRWFKEYGETFLYWYGTKPRLVVTDPELSKQILSNKFGFYVKPKTKPSLIALIGYGLATVNGSVWARHRRILNPAFSIDKLKVMVKRMAACTISMLDEWNNQAATDQGLKLEMNEEFQKLTADIISHTSFGSNYLQGREAFKAQKELQRYCAVSNANLFIPGSQYLPTPSNLKIQKLESKIRNALKGIIEGRIKSKATGNASDRYGDDLLGQMIGASETGSTKDCPSLNMDEIMDECKTFFFAGHETTSNLLTWTSFLLSLHQDWQETLRQEVLEACGTQIPDADTLAKLKITNMVLLEVLRLYCPAIMLIREASEDMKLGNLRIPKGTGLVIPVVKIHRSKEYWGEDANDFNPLRFSNGVSKAAKHPNALLAFAIGPRACIGQNFAMMEAKTVLALLLQRFRFSLSPQYKHMPVDNLTLLPKYGLPIIVKPLNA